MSRTNLRTGAACRIRPTISEGYVCIGACRHGAIEVETDSENVAGTVRQREMSEALRVKEDRQLPCRFRASKSI